MACTTETGKQRPGGAAFASTPQTRRIVSGLERARRLPRATRQALSGFMTQYVQRGYEARRLGDEAVRAGQVDVRPTAVLDADISAATDLARLFGDAVTAAEAEGVRGDAWNRLVSKEGKLAGGRAAEALGRAASAAAAEARDAGLLAPDAPVEAFSDAVAGLVKAAGGSAPASAQALVELGVDAAQAARENRGKAQLADWARDFHGATDVKRSTRSTIDLLVDGKPRHVRVDPQIAAATKEATSDAVAGVLAMTARLARMGQLTLNAGWQIANLPIDIHRSFMTRSHYGAVTGVPKVIADSLSAFGVSRWAALSPLQRDVLLARGDVSPRAKRQIAELQEMERSGALPSEWRPDIVAGEARSARVPDVGGMIGEEYLTGLHGWADLMRRMVTSPLATIERGMRVMEANPKVADYRRTARTRGKAPGLGDVLEIREGVGSPPFADTYRGLNPWLGSLFHYFSSTVNGMIADGRTFTNPRTAPGAALKLATTVIAPAVLQNMIRSNAFGTEDDDTWMGAYTRGLQALPTWRLAKGIHLPVAVDRDAPGGPRMVMFTIETNRTFSPLLGAVAAAWSKADAGGTAGDAAAEAGKALVGGLLPGQAVAIDTAIDAYDLLRGQNPRDEFRERDVFTRAEWEGASRVDKAAKFFLYHVPGQFGFRAAGIAAMRAIGKPELAGVRARADEAGLQLDEVPVAGALARRFVSVDATMGRRERDRLQVEADRTAKAREGYARDAAANRAAREFLDANPTMRRESILAEGRRFVKSLGLRGAERTRELTSYRRSLFLGYREGREFSSWAFAPMDSLESLAKGRNAKERAALVDWTRAARGVRAISDDRARAIRRALRRAGR